MTNWYRDIINLLESEISESVSGVFYHGTNATFDKFEKRMGTVSSIFGSEKIDRHGFFFTKNLEFAKLFGSNVLKVKLTLNNPLDMTNGIHSKIEKQLADHGIPRDFLWNGDDWEKFDGDEGEAFVEALIALGYDGAVIEEPDDNGNQQTSYIAFGSDQITVVG